MTVTKCTKTVGIPPDYFHFTKCSRRATATTPEGQHLCTQHYRMEMERRRRAGRIDLPEGSAMTSQELIDAIRKAGYEAGSYSGRGMYGGKFVAVALSGDESVWGLAYILGHKHGEIVGLFPEPSSDAVGMGTIAYWPQYAWPEEPEASQELTASDLIAEPDDLGAPYNAPDERDTCDECGRSIRVAGSEDDHQVMEDGSELCSSCVATLAV